MIFALMLATLFWVVGVALADGGGPENPAGDLIATVVEATNPPPLPTSGPFLFGGVYSGSR